VSSTESDGNISLPTEIASTDKSNEFASYQYHVNDSIKRKLMENFHQIKFLREDLNSNIYSTKMIVKHCTMMNNQIKNSFFTK
jgi:hypothetical protein